MRLPKRFCSRMAIIAVTFGLIITSRPPVSTSLVAKGLEKDPRGRPIEVDHDPILPSATGDPGEQVGRCKLGDADVEHAVDLQDREVVIVIRELRVVFELFLGDGLQRRASDGYESVVDECAHHIT